jgi:hypothetical protein
VVEGVERGVCVCVCVREREKKKQAGEKRKKKKHKQNAQRLLQGPAQGVHRLQLAGDEAGPHARDGRFQAAVGSGGGEGLRV